MKDRFAFFLACTLLLTAHSALGAPSLFLIGTWEDADKTEHGTISIVVERVDGAQLEGILRLTGSKDCVRPISFRGTVFENGVTIIADTPEVCGYNGTLTALVTKARSESNSGDERYVGTFSYRFLGVTWKRGTFQLDPEEHPKKQSERNRPE